MEGAVALNATDRKLSEASLRTRVRASAPSFAEVFLAGLSAILLALSFPDFDLWPLAWIALVPLLLVVVRCARPARAFMVGLIWGVLFFYGSCWWLTYSMIHYGHLRPEVAYPLLLLPVVFIALFPAVTCWLLAVLTRRCGSIALFAIPFVWVAFEWLRFVITGEHWNAIGYAEAFHPTMIQTSRWGGVYSVSFLVILVNAAIAFALVTRTRKARVTALGILLLTSLTTFSPLLINKRGPEDPNALVVAVQPNVPMDPIDDAAELELLQRHLELGTRALHESPDNPATTRLVIWPESPMNFEYSIDPKLQATLADFAIKNHTSVLLNSAEPAPNHGVYNSALMINQQGRMIAQYDKIHLMPFGEHVPLPRWMPGVSLIPPLVGDFTPGEKYSLMPLDQARAGVSICFEAASPMISRTFTEEGADLLINISNDGYLGPTPVMRQHLANAIFRAVENDRTMVRVTNTGITALIDANGTVKDATKGFEPAVRTWAINTHPQGQTFYTRYGDAFAYLCGAFTVGFIALLFLRKRNHQNAN
jgi:apolipoprotein N-acyltransferase